MLYTLIIKGGTTPSLGNLSVHLSLTFVSNDNWWIGLQKKKAQAAEEGAKKELKARLDKVRSLLYNWLRGKRLMAGTSGSDRSSPTWTYTYIAWTTGSFLPGMRCWGWKARYDGWVFLLSHLIIFEMETDDRPRETGWIRYALLQGFTSLSKPRRTLDE